MVAFHKKFPCFPPIIAAENGFRNKIPETGKLLSKKQPRKFWGLPQLVSLTNLSGFVSNAA
jgi:hypothetical protein